MIEKRPGNAKPGSAEPGSAEPQLGTCKEGRAELGLGAPGEGAPGEGAPVRWYSRGYLPHYDDMGKLQSITFRLADSLPQEKLRELKEDLARLPFKKRDVERRKRIERWMDAGMGCCALKHPSMAQVMQETLLRFDGERYRLLAWCIMPNHVHVLIEPMAELGKIVQSWKSYTGRWALARSAELGLGVPGCGAPRKSFWMREYWDRYIRDRKHFHAVVEYIHNNPVKAQLCKKATEWPWSSAGNPGNPGNPGSAEPQLGTCKRGSNV